MRLRLLTTCLLLLGAGRVAPPAQAGPATNMLTRGFAPVFVATDEALRASKLSATEMNVEIKKLCGSLHERFRSYNWASNPCGDVNWHAPIRSRKGNPLLYAEFGKGEEVTLILSGVHPDELTPIPLIFQFAQYLSVHTELYSDRDVKIILAPLVNPDGFINQTIPTRTNASGVDLNRNFYTVDWYVRAKNFWREWRKSQLTHFPGHFPNSELETLFQIMLIERFNPDKILSVHAPLGFLDYDGPGEGVQRRLTEMERRAKRLAQEISEKSNNYKIVDYSFYPGSLGNFAGNERKIPTITLELASTSPAKADEYWKSFLPGLIQSIQYPFQRERLSKGPGGLFYLGEFFDDQGSVPAKKRI